MRKTHWFLVLPALLLWGCSAPQPPVAGDATKAKTRKALAPELEKKPERMKAPDAVRGVYLTAWSAGSTRKMEKIRALLDKSEANSVVIDLRDAGHVYVKTESKLANESGAVSRAIRDLPALVKGLVDDGIYPIARIACFRDVFVPKKRPDRAVNLVKGGIWKDRAGYAWLDPYNKANWDYIGETVQLALDAGFPEVQLDYVRFPSEGKTSTMVFPSRKAYPDPKASPTEVVREFSRAMRDKCHAAGAIISADIFGIVSSGKGDQGIGQELEIVSEPFDVLSPMVYPSHYAKGEYGVANPDASPYAIVKKSLMDYAKRMPGKEIRPWLQDFSLGVIYGKEQVRAQIKATYESGYDSWLLWNPRNNYTTQAFIDTVALMPRKKPEPAVEVKAEG